MTDFTVGTDVEEHLACKKTPLQQFVFHWVLKLTWNNAGKVVQLKP